MEQRQQQQPALLSAAKAASDGAYDDEYESGMECCCVEAALELFVVTNLRMRLRLMRNGRKEVGLSGCEAAMQVAGGQALVAVCSV